MLLAGAGMGSAVLDAVAEIYHADGLKISITASHPAMIQSLARGPNWTCTDVARTGTAPNRPPPAAPAGLR